MQISTADLDDEMQLSASGRIVRMQRTNHTPFTANVGSAEVIDLRTQGGKDKVTVNALGGVQNLQTLQIDAGDDNDVINATALEAAFALIGRGGAGDDILFGGVGNDSLLGEEGRDIILSNDGNDFISGGDDNDILISGNGNDVLLGGDGNDTLSAGSGNDTLLAGNGNDSLNGGADVDFLDGGAGQDSAVNGETLVNIS